MLNQSIIGDANSKNCINIPNVSDIQSVFPTFEEIHKALTTAFNIPFDVLSKLGLPTPPLNLHMHWPDLPSFANYDWAMHDIKWPSVSASYAALASYTGQLFAVLKKACLGLFGFIGEIPFPKIPEFNIDLADFMSIKPLDFIGAEIDKIKNGISNEYEKLKSILPLNMPHWASFDIPTMQAVTAIQTAASGYLGTMIDFLTGLINKFLGFLAHLKLPHPSIPTLPKMPSISDIASQLYDNATRLYGQLSAELSQVTDRIKNGIASEYEIVKAKLHDAMTIISNSGGSISQMISNLHFPDFNFHIPSPLFPSFDMPEIELTHSINIMTSQMFSSIIEKLKKHIDILPLISVVWPKIKELLGDIPSIPSICHNDIPNNLTS